MIFDLHAYFPMHLDTELDRNPARRQIAQSHPRGHLAPAGSQDAFWEWLNAFVLDFTNRICNYKHPGGRTGGLTSSSGSASTLRCRCGCGPALRARTRTGQSGRSLTTYLKAPRRTSLCSLSSSYSPVVKPRLVEGLCAGPEAGHRKPAEVACA